MSLRQVQCEKAARVTAFGAVTLLLSLYCLRGETNSFPEFRPESAREYWRAVAPLAREQAGVTAESCLIQARLQNHLGLTAEAEQWARRGLELEPKRADMEVFVAELLIPQDRMEEAARCLRRAIAADPRVPGGHRLLGMVLDRLGDQKGAAAAFATATELYPTDAKARLVLGRFLMEQGRTEEAVDQLEKACELDPESANNFYVLFQAQTRAGNQAAASKTWPTFQRLKEKEKVLEAPAMGVEPGAAHNEERARAATAEFHNSMANLLAQQGKFSLAEAHLRQATRVAPQQPLAYERLAALCVRDGRLAEAKELFANLQRLRPKQATYRVNLATVLLQLRDPAAAAAELQAALELDPAQPEALYNLARLCLTSHARLPEALELCRRLIAVQPKAASYDLLGWALFANGRTNEALVAATQAVEKEPDNAGYRQRQQKLQQLVGGKP